MPEPIVITISHQLGRDAAKHRIDDGLGKIREQLAPFVGSLHYAWADYRLEFDMVAARQTINGRIEVEERLVRIQINLPFLLRVLSKPIVARIRGEGARLLDKPERT